MGFFSFIADAVKSVGSMVSRVVKKVYEVCTSDSVVDAYNGLERVINRPRANSSHISNYREPDFLGDAEIGAIEKKIREQNELIVKNENRLKESKNISALQTEFTRLRMSAELIDRSMRNVKMHASSLSVHYQNMRNINGLIDNVNSLRHGLKAVISTLNHTVNVVNGSMDGAQIQKIQGIDIDPKQGAISQLAAYDAFDRTRELLRNEVVDLAKVATKHLSEIDNLKQQALNVGGRLGQDVVMFIDSEIIPIIKNAESAGIILRSEVSKLPAAVRDHQGMIVFEDGKIKLEDDVSDKSGYSYRGTSQNLTRTFDRVNCSS